MAEDDRRPKRSRFDQTEPEPKRASRFDRRSRSPVSRHSESRRSRSPLSREPREPYSPAADGRRTASGDPAAAAAAAAARIKASLEAKKIQHVDVPPIRSTGSPVAKQASASSGQSTSNINTDVYIADGDYIKDIEVNDLRNRYTLTKGSTQKMIKEETGADVTTRGNYYPDKSMATAANPPLYLHVTSTSKIGLEKAIEKIEELMKQELPNLVDERRFRRREPEQFERDEFGRRKWPEERIPINLEPLAGFNLRAQVVGQGGMYVKHIQQETRCRVQIKGRGSGFKEHSTQMESDEPMYLHVAGPDPSDVQKAKELCVDLLDNVRAEYEKFKANPPPQQQYGGYGNGSYQSRDRPSYGGYGSYGGAQSPPMPGAAVSPTTPAAPPGTAGSPTDYAAQYAQYYAGGQDPYAAYGGYQGYVQYYQYYAQQQTTQQGQAPPPPPPGNDAPPPPPGGAPPSASSNPPPPPPPGAPGAGSYSAVPPPPGM